MSGFDVQYINNELVELRKLYEKDSELKESFHRVDIGLSQIIELCKNWESASYDFSGNDYFNFKNTLERKIKK